MPELIVVLVRFVILTKDLSEQLVNYLNIGCSAVSI